jgi:hypothetical protein
VPDAVEELLRFDGSVPVSSFRFATEDLEVGGVTIPEGSIVTDRAQLGQPRPALTRTRTRSTSQGATQHMSFGHGVTTAWAPPSPGWRRRRRCAGSSSLPDLPTRRPVDELQCCRPPVGLPRAARAAAALHPAPAQT